MINIKPITITSFPEVVTVNRADVPSFTINKENIENPASATVFIGVEQGEDFVQKAGYTVSMTEEQYAEWGTDDEYAIDCFLTNLGIERE